MPSGASQTTPLGILDGRSGQGENFTPAARSVSWHRAAASGRGALPAEPRRRAPPARRLSRRTRRALLRGPKSQFAASGALLFYLAILPIAAWAIVQVYIQSFAQRAGRPQSIATRGLQVLFSSRYSRARSARSLEWPTLRIKRLPLRSTNFWVWRTMLTLEREHRLMPRQRKSSRG